MKRLFGIVAYSICLLVALVLLLWFRPQWLLSSQSLAWAQNRWAPQVSVPWKKIHINIQNGRGLQKSISISGKDFCLSYRESQVCWDHLAVNLNIDLVGSPFWHLKNFQGESREVSVVAKNFESDVEAPVEFSSWHQQSQDIQHILRSVFEELPSSYALKVPHFSIQLGDSALSGSLHLLPIKWLAAGQWKAQKINLSIDIEKTVILRGFWEDQNYKGQLEIAGPLKINPTLSLSASVQAKRENKKEFLQQVLRAPLEVEAKLELFPKAYSLRIEPFDIPLGAYGEGLRVGGCQLRGEEALLIRVLVSCPGLRYKARLEDSRWKHAHQKLKLKQTLDFDLLGKVEEKVLRGFEDGPLADFRATLKTIENDLIKISGYGEWELLRAGDKIQSRPKDLDLVVEVPRFQELERALRATTLALPSPLNTMTGRALVSGKKMTSTDSGYQLNLVGELDLKSSENQILKGTLTAVLSRDDKNKLQPFALIGEVLLEKIYFQIPPFDPLRGFPAVSSDPRVDSGREPQKPVAKTQISPLRLDLRIRTIDPRSIRLFYYLVSPSVSFGVEGHLTNDRVSFVVRGESPAKLTYLRREISLQRFKVSKNAPKDEPLEVDLRLFYQSTDYKIYVDVVGAVENPTVKLSSDPSLPRSDIISVLIYNRTSNDLTRNQTESVGGAGSAMKDRTLGLFGIWALASTPIESVSYDSASQSYRAQVALPGKVTLDIGTDWETVQNLSLRRQIGENLAIITSYEPGDGAKGMGDVFLQKEWSYE